MVTSLVGQNSFLLRSTLRKQKQKFIQENGEFSLESIDASDWEVGRLLDVVSALPFLTARRMVVVEGLASNKIAAEHIDKILESVSEETDLVFVEPKIDKRSVLYKTLKKQTALIECNEVDPRDAPKWLVAEVKRRGGTLSIGDAMYLVGRVGAGQQLLISELEKLLLYNKVISRKTIELLTEQAPMSNIFDLLDAAFGGDILKALKLYEDQRAQNVDPLAIEALFVWQLHILLVVKAAGAQSADTVAAEAGISPYVAKKTAALAQKRSYLQIKQYVRLLAAAEYEMKTLSVDSDEIMKNYIVAIGTK